MSPLVLRKILWVFVNTLTADGKYPDQDFENLPLPIQMQLSERPITFSELFVPFLDLHQILNILNKRMIVIANIFAKLETVKNLFRPLSKNRRLRRHFESQHVKVSQILAESL